MLPTHVVRARIPNQNCQHVCVGKTRVRTKVVERPLEKNNNFPELSSNSVELWLISVLLPILYY